MTEAEVRDRIWAYVVENFLYMRPDFRVGPDDSLLRRGVFDSLGVMEVIAFVEESFGVKVEQEDITEANFGTLNAIGRYVVARWNGTAPGTGQPVP
jgi:acyl carrier protein